MTGFAVRPGGAGGAAALGRVTALAGADALAPVLLDHGGATGVALTWELQLLATPTAGDS